MAVFVSFPVSTEGKLQVIVAVCCDCASEGQSGVNPAYDIALTPQYNLQNVVLSIYLIFLFNIQSFIESMKSPAKSSNQ